MSGRNGAKLSQREKLDYIHSELRSFYEYCKEAGISDDEMDIICRPLTNAMRKATVRRWTRVCLFVVMMIAVGYTVSQTDTFQWHASALARIALIKILPLWDWTPMYYNKCLIQKPPAENEEPKPLSTADCIPCEAIKTVPHLKDTGYHEVFNHFLMRGSPVVVTDGSIGWVDPNVNVSALIFKDDRLRGSVPCRILSNVRAARQPMDLEEVVASITGTKMPNWFVHFQNCDIKTVKFFRGFVTRPYFLAPHIAPSHFNWVMMSKNYDTDRYKTLELDAGLIVMSQLRGVNHIQLKPKPPCVEECHVLHLELQQGQTLVFGNAVWEFQYLPGKEDNLALLTETDWMET